MINQPFEPYTLHIDEPALEFGYGQECEYAKDGLFFFGPFKPIPGGGNLRFGVIGTAAGLARFDEWVGTVRGQISTETDRAHRMAWPGFEAVFGCAMPARPMAQISVEANALSEAIRRENRHEGVHEAVTLFEEPLLRYHREQEATPMFWFVVVPEEVFKWGRPKQDIPHKQRTKSRLPMRAKQAQALMSGGAGFLFDEVQEEAQKTLAVEAYEVNFHHQLKRRLLSSRIAVQVLRETTLAPWVQVDKRGQPVRRIDDPATVAWNICTTAFFKNEGKPWILKGVRPGVCYVGLVFKQITTQPNGDNACCGAQMFLDSGDGVVFRGAIGKWYSEDSRQYHLSGEKAAEIIDTVIAAYRDEHGVAPREVFVHGRTRFNEEEWNGFLSAAPAGTSVVAVRIRRAFETKLFRAEGKTPVLRGTAYVVSPKKAFLWSLGYTPRLQTYPGWEVPTPLEVEVSLGDADIIQVIKDILGLTKLNYNACIFGDGSPVTLRFADAVGEILTAGPMDEKLPPLPFRYYI
ncbi:hypothetical protein SAMN04488038_101208 [Solimonas aquatica]|uniref:Piwi domain-containing protein n=1 Tax=Solimonas aquatica TaxID=489703 RepID=A0A1H8ZYY8_9GAMM|nr:hypothetical protein [Solimonas aquatica]SEP69463.1 hypothetical protein SAMN04488038_101208 [Solimonas aquatica]